MADSKIIVKLFLGEQDGDSWVTSAEPEEVLWVSDYRSRARLVKMGGVIPAKLARELTPLRYKRWDMQVDDDGNEVYIYCFEPEQVRTE